MKMSTYGMLFMLVALAVGPLVYFNGGKEYLNELLFSRSPVGSEVASELKLNKDVVYAPVTTDKKVTVYKWKDKNGIWQFGGIAPPGATGIESLTLQPNVNIMKSIDVPGEDVAEAGGRSGVVSLRNGKNKDTSSKGNKDDDGIGISQDALDNPYSPESIAELFKSSKNIQKALDSRHQQQSE